MEKKLTSRAIISANRAAEDASIIVRRQLPVKGDPISSRSSFDFGEDHLAMPQFSTGG